MPLPLMLLPKLVDTYIETLKHLAPDEWDGSIQIGDGDSEPIDEVEKVDGGLNGATAWCKTRFTMDGVTHLLEAKGPAKTFGQRGGNDRIWLDGTEMTDKPDFVLKLIWYGFRVRISGSYKLGAGSNQVRYRFDGTVGK